MLCSSVVKILRTTKINKVIRYITNESSLIAFHPVRMRERYCHFHKIRNICLLILLMKKYIISLFIISVGLNHMKTSG